MNRQQELVGFINAAFESSVFLAPRDPGLTYDEVIEVCRQANYGDGEARDALAKVATSYLGKPNTRLLPGRDLMMFWHVFVPQAPEHRNIAAFDFIQEQLTALARAHTTAFASIAREVLVQRAVEATIPVIDIEASITLWIFAGVLIDKAGTLSFPPQRHEQPLPSTQMNNSRQQPIQNERRARAHSIVRDVVSRRVDGRPKHADPFDAFSESLSPLGYKPFRMWWVSTVAELRRLDVNSAPTSIAVLSAALIEGALTLVVKHARSLNLEVFRSKDYEEEPYKWKIENLITSAAMGRESGILDDFTRQRAVKVVSIR